MPRLELTEETVGFLRTIDGVVDGEPDEIVREALVEFARTHEDLQVVELVDGRVGDINVDHDDDKMRIQCGEVVK